MQIIKVEYVWTKERLVQAVRNHSNKTMRPWLRRTWNIFLTVLLLLFIWMMIDSGGKTVDALGFLFIPLVFVIGFFPQMQNSRWWITRSFEKKPGANTQVIFEFTADKIKVDVDGLAFSELVWLALAKVAESPEGFMLYHTNQLFNWVPFDSFENEDDIGILREWAKNSGVKFEAAKKAARTNRKQ